MESDWIPYWRDLQKAGAVDVQILNSEQMLVVFAQESWFTPYNNGMWYGVT